MKGIEASPVKIKVLIGNKSDLLTGNSKKKHDPVTQQEAERLSKAYGCEYFPCNSLNSESVGVVFSHISQCLSGFNDYPYDLSRLAEKGIVAGRRIFQSEEFLKSLKESNLFSN